MSNEEYLIYNQADITWIKRVLAAAGITSRDGFTALVQNRDKGASWQSFLHIGPHRNYVLAHLENVDDESWVRMLGLPIHQD